MVDAAQQPVRGEGYRSVWLDLLTTEFRQGYVEAAGLRTRYVEAGPPSGPPLVLLHGTGGHWETFSRNIPRLSRDFHCYAPDMLGCGFTDRPDKPYEIRDYAEHVLAFLDVMGVSRASFIGVSLGSWVASRVAVSAPERMDKLILNAPAGLLPLSAAASSAVASRRDSTAMPSWRSVRQTLDHLFFDPASLTDDITAIRLHVYSRPGGAQLLNRTMTLFDPEIRRRNLLTTEEWGRIAAPTLIIAHVDSPDDYLETGQTIAALIPDATVLEVREASHWPHFEQPDVFNDAAQAFLTRGSLFAT